MGFIRTVGPHSLNIFRVAWLKDSLGEKMAEDLDPEPFKLLKRVSDVFHDPDGDMVYGVPFAHLLFVPALHI